MQLRNRARTDTWYFGLLHECLLLHCHLQLYGAVWGFKLPLCEKPSKDHAKRAAENLA
jgi:hypothetical protein